jgi:flagella basal body P-ring formation protein FlgA
MKTLQGMAAASLLLACSSASAGADVRALPVPAATIYPNDIITNAFVTERRFRVTERSVAGFATRRSELVGMQARRRLLAGKPVPLAALGMAQIVKRGAIVSAHYDGEGLSILTTLIALQDGAEGDLIDARNSESGVVVRAMVRGDGSLTVTE